MIALFVSKEEHIFDIQFKLPFVNDKLDKKSGGWTKYINPSRENYLDESIHANTICYCGVILGGFLLNPYILTIHNLAKSIINTTE